MSACTHCPEVSQASASPGPSLKSRTLSEPSSCSCFLLGTCPVFLHGVPPGPNSELHLPGGDGSYRSLQPQDRPWV